MAVGACPDRPALRHRVHLHPGAGLGRRWADLVHRRAKGPAQRDCCPRDRWVVPQGPSLSASIGRSGALGPCPVIGTTNRDGAPRPCPDRRTTASMPVLWQCGRGTDRRPLPVPAAWRPILRHACERHGGKMGTLLAGSGLLNGSAVADWPIVQCHVFLRCFG
jgi:hypothetical protein